MKDIKTYYVADEIQEINQIITELVESQNKLIRLMTATNKVIRDDEGNIVGTQIVEE